MEGYSLLMMCWLYKSDSKREIQNYFGMADTLVVPTVMAFSAVFDIIVPNSYNTGDAISFEMDLVLGMIAISIGLFAILRTVQ